MGRADCGKGLNPKENRSQTSSKGLGGGAKGHEMSFITNIPCQG